MTQPPSSIVQAARAAMAVWKVPASVSIAQWADESGWGVHMPPGSNNPLGIKALPGQAYVTVPTEEDDKYGRAHTVTAAFRKFPTIADAFLEHDRLIACAPIYAPAMRCLPDVAQFVAAMAPHYASDSQYRAKLMAIINGSKLTQYDGAPA